LLACQLFLQRIGFCGFARLLKDAMAIMIERQWPSVLLQHLLHQQKVACCILLLAEDGCSEFARGIIDRSDQAQPGASLLQPSMPTAIDLHQHALLRVPHTSASMLPPPLGSRRTHSCCQHDATHTRA
jgi:hypothetical protein